MNNDKSVALYQAIKDSNERRVFESWHASSISDCPRAHYYKRLGVKPLNDPSAALVIRWGAGHLLEEMIRPQIETVYGKTESNQRLTSKTLDLTGEFDNLVLSDSRLVEVKSVHDMAFVERDGKTYLKEKTGTMQRAGREVNTWGIKETPYLHHELQNHAYVLLLGEEGIDVKNIDYVYISLSGRIVVYSTEVQKELLDNVKARLDTLNKAWKAKKPPVCICSPEHNLYESVTKYCDYKNQETGECCSLELLKEK
jgi:hypothetical protein